MTEIDIRSGVELPSIREEITLHTADGLNLVGELALPVGKDPIATILTLHPLPTHGGFMDSHILRKLANRLPALTGIAVLRFNTRGTTSPRGTSEGEFDGGAAERFDLDAALQFLESRGLSQPPSMEDWLRQNGLQMPTKVKPGVPEKIEFRRA